MEFEQTSKCEICDRIFTGVRSENALAKHLTKTHKMTGYDYYHKFRYVDGEHICNTESCNNITMFFNMTKGYQDHCSTKCAANDVMVREKNKATMLEKYGREHSWAGKYGERQCDKTIYEKTGYTNPMKSPEGKAKQKKTMLERYGKEHNWEGTYGERDCDITRREKISDEDFYASWKVGMINKYGTDNYFNLRENVIEDWIRIFGVDNPMKVPTINKKSLSNQYRKSYRLKKYKTIFDDEIMYQSKLELEFIHSCESKNIRILDGDSINYTLDGKDHIYFIDFKIFFDDKWQLVEIKGDHFWYRNELKSGKIKAKTDAAIEFSINNDYHPFRFDLKE